jgi:hypothetical protein
MRRRLGSRPRSCSRRRPDGPLCSGLGFQPSGRATTHLRDLTIPACSVRRSAKLVNRGLPGRGGAISPGRRFGPRRRRKMHDDLPRTKRTVDELRRPGSGMPAAGPVRPLGSRRGCDLVDWRTQRPRRTTRTWPRALPGRITVVLVDCLPFLVVLFQYFGQPRHPSSGLLSRPRSPGGTDSGHAGKC